jgi:hypothetical protein
VIEASRKIWNRSEKSPSYIKDARDEQVLLNYLILLRQPSTNFANMRTSKIRQLSVKIL